MKRDFRETAGLAGRVSSILPFCVGLFAFLAGGFALYGGPDGTIGSGGVVGFGLGYWVVAAVCQILVWLCWRKSSTVLLVLAVTHELLLFSLWLVMWCVMAAGERGNFSSSLNMQILMGILLLAGGYGIFSIAGKRLRKSRE